MICFDEFLVVPCDTLESTNVYCNKVPRVIGLSRVRDGLSFRGVGVLMVVLRRSHYPYLVLMDTLSIALSGCHIIHYFQNIGIGTYVLVLYERKVQR